MIKLSAYLNLVDTINELLSIQQAGALNLLDIINGVFGLIIVIFSVFIGIYIASKYFEYKDKIFLYIGFSWIGLNQGWWGPAISFITTITLGISLPDPLYFTISNIGVPVFAMIWMNAITDLMYEKNKKLILILYGVFVGIFDMLLFIALLTDPAWLGETTSPVDSKYGSIFGLYLIAIVASIMISGVIFASKSIKSGKSLNQLKGKFLLIAFILYFIGAIADALFDLGLITLPIIRTILILSGFLFYLGWIMPDAIKKKLIKEE